MKIVLILFLFFSCKQKMSNDEIIKEVTKCREAKLGYIFFTQNMTTDVTSVRCSYGKGE